MGALKSSGQGLDLLYDSRAGLMTIPPKTPPKVRATDNRLVTPFIDRRQKVQRAYLRTMEPTVSFVVTQALRGNSDGKAKIGGSARA